jgi:hypothetical protein
MGVAYCLSKTVYNMDFAYQKRYISYIPVYNLYTSVQIIYLVYNLYTTSVQIIYLVYNLYTGI